MPSGGQQVERSRDLDRLLTFVDAVVAVAITLLVLPLVDLAAEIHSSSDSVATLIADHSGRFWAFGLSFVVIARLWLAQHALMRSVTAVNNYVVWWLMLWSLSIVFLPFPTALLPIGGDQVVVKILYIGTLTVASILLSLLAVTIGRTRSIRDTEAGPPVAPVLTTAALFAAALAVSLAFPVLSYAPLLLLLATDPVLHVARRVQRAHTMPRDDA